MVSVVPSLADSGAPGLTQLDEDGTTAAGAYLAQACDRLPQNLRVETVVLQGSPASSLAEFVVRERIDLVVMSTRGWGGLRRMLLGSTAEAMVRSSVPTLLVRAPVPTDEPAPAPAVTVGEIMSQPVATAGEDATLAEVAQLMLDRGVGCVPLVDAQGRVTGIITETDISGRGRYDRIAGDRIPYVFGQRMVREEIEARYEAGRKITAREIMSPVRVTAAENEVVADVVQRMLRRELSCLPVLRDGELVGLVTRHDLLKMTARNPMRT
jgi:CBS domain-containing protein